MVIIEPIADPQSFFPPCNLGLFSRPRNGAIRVLGLEQSQSTPHVVQKSTSRSSLGARDEAEGDGEKLLVPAPTSAPPAILTRRLWMPMKKNIQRLSMVRKVPLNPD